MPYGHVSEHSILLLVRFVSLPTRFDVTLSKDMSKGGYSAEAKIDIN